MGIPLRMRLFLIWFKIFRPNHSFNSLVKISKTGEGVKNILFLLPAEKQFAQIAAHFIKSGKKKNNLNLNYVLHQNSLVYYQDELFSKMILFTDDDLNWFGAIKSKPILNKINNAKYDALIDLNQSVNQTLSLLTMELNIPIKIGFETAFSDQLYSIVIEPQKNGFLEENYMMIEQILGIK